MQLVVLGVNHNSAPIEIREQLAIKDEEYKGMYEFFAEDSSIAETFIISTCNRVEFYFIMDIDISNFDRSSILDIVCRAISISKNDLTRYNKSDLDKYLYFISGRDSLKHLFSVASGIDSLVLGEPQILGQIKDAFNISKLYTNCSQFMTHLQDYTLKTAKRVRTDTGIASSSVSISYVAVELAKKIFSNFSSATALVIGAGEMCELAIKHFVSANIGSIIVTNRTYEKAEKLAMQCDGTAIAFDKLTSVLDTVDIVISSTGADKFIVTYDMIQEVIARRKFKPIFFIDIAVPRDIDPKLSEIANVYLYDIDDLKQIVEDNRKSREKEAKKAVEIIDKAVDKFYDSIEVLKINPILKDVSDLFNETRDIELKRYIDRFKISDTKEIERLEQFVSTITQKQLHNIFSNIKQNAKISKKYSLSDAVKLIFSKKKDV